jgi:ATPase subunit of ABC transporter with duplicated ATPase domains
LNTILELTPDGITRYGGNYDFYRERKEVHLHALTMREHEQTKEVREARQKAREVAEQRQKREARGKAAGAGGSLPRIAAGLLQRRAEQRSARANAVHQDRVADLSDDLQRIRAEIIRYTPLTIRLKDPDVHPGKVLIKATEISACAGRRWLWKGLSFMLRAGERTRVSGRNGSGKTTFLRIMAGLDEPADGTVIRGALRIFYLDQEYKLIDPLKTVMEQAVAWNSCGLREHELKSMLHHAQLGTGTWGNLCGSLSGGERMKLALCCLSIQDKAPDLLILDEPTNDIDLESAGILTRSLQSFKGALLMVSHDEQFVSDLKPGATVLLDDPA